MQPGNRLNNRYTLERYVGSGVHGGVWFGHDSVLDRPVRVKVLDAQLSADEEIRGRFRATSLAVAALDLPGIVDVYDCVDHDDDGTTVVCQIAGRLEGVPLREVLTQQTLSSDDMLEFVTGIGWALNEAHQRGVWHHRLLSSNLIVAPDGAVTMVDFGFMPAHDDGNDVSALGAIAYECLTGHRPSGEDSASLLPADLPPSVAALVTRAQSRRASIGFVSVAALASECEQINHTNDLLGALLERDGLRQPTIATPEPTPAAAPKPRPSPTPTPAAEPRLTAESGFESESELEAPTESRTVPDPEPAATAPIPDAEPTPSGGDDPEPDVKSVPPLFAQRRPRSGPPAESAPRPAPVAEWPPTAPGRETPPPSAAPPAPQPESEPEPVEARHEPTPPSSTPDEGSGIAMTWSTPEAAPQSPPAPRPESPTSSIAVTWRQPDPATADSGSGTADSRKPQLRDATVPSGEPARKPRRKRLIFLAVLVTVLLVIGVVALVGLLPGDPARSNGEDKADTGWDWFGSTQDESSESSKSKKRKNDDSESPSTSDRASSELPSPSDSGTFTNPTDPDDSDPPDEPDQVKVPDIVGQNAEAATAKLKNAGFKANVVESGEGGHRCPVYDQSPNGGDLLAEGSTVDVMVKLADKPENCDGGDSPETSVP